MKAESKENRKKTPEAKKTSHPTDQSPGHQMNRKQRQELARRIQNEGLSLEVVHPDAAGIAKIHHLQLRCLKWQAVKLGLQLIEIPAS